VLDRLAPASRPGTGQIAFSADGTAVYLPRPEREQPLAWIDRAGVADRLRLAPADWSNVRVSPDGRRLAFDRFEGSQTDVCVYDIDRDVSNRLTSDPADDWWPLWSPDGRYIAFRSARDRAFNLYWQPADGSGTTQRLTSSANPQSPVAWHPSGRLLVVSETHPQTSNDLFLLPLEGDPSALQPGTLRPFLNSPAAETSAAFSPDGRWIAYSSDEGGRTGVYVRPFPGPGGQWLIAADGMYPTWSTTRRELLFVTADQRVLVSSYNTDGTTFQHEAPRPWSPQALNRRSRGIVGLIDGRGFDLHPDGQRVVGAPASAGVSEGRVVFLFNLFDELRRLAPRPD
jgi:Tol biopolymer transport system component